MLKSEGWPIFLPVKALSKHMEKKVFMARGKIFRNYSTASKQILIKIQLFPLSFQQISSSKPFRSRHQ
jgi:hypothetical protein